MREAYFQDGERRWIPRGIKRSLQTLVSSACLSCVFICSTSWLCFFTLCLKLLRVPKSYFIPLHGGLSWQRSPLSGLWATLSSQVELTTSASLQVVPAGCLGRVMGGSWTSLVLSVVHLPLPWPGSTPAHHPWWRPCRTDLRSGRRQRLELLFLRVYGELLFLGLVFGKLCTLLHNHLPGKCLCLQDRERLV